MRTNLVMRFNCSECGNQLVLRLPEESAEPIELPLRCENPPNPIGANKLNAGFIMIEPCVVDEDDDKRSVDAEIRELRHQVNHLTAILCAIDNELIDAGFRDQIVTAAQINGKVDIYGILNGHHNYDKKRLEKELLKYSEHERRILKQLL